MKTETYHLQSVKPEIECDILVDEFFIKVSPTLARKVYRDEELRTHGQAMAVLFYLLAQLPWRLRWADRVTRNQIAQAIGVPDLGTISDDLSLLERLGYIHVNRCHTGSAIALTMVSDDPKTRAIIYTSLARARKLRDASTPAVPEESEQERARTDEDNPISSLAGEDFVRAALQAGTPEQEVTPHRSMLSNRVRQYIESSWYCHMGHTEHIILDDIGDSMDVPLELDHLDRDLALDGSQRARSSFEKSVDLVYPRLFRCLSEALSARLKDLCEVRGTVLFAGDDQWRDSIADVQAEKMIDEYLLAHDRIRQNIVLLVEGAAEAKATACDEDVSQPFSCEPSPDAEVDMDLPAVDDMEDSA